MCKLGHLFFVFSAVLLLGQWANAQSPLRLIPVTPCRRVDTRPANGGGGPIQGGTAQSFTLPNLAQSGGSQGRCTPFSLANASAYSLNVTVVPINGGPRLSDDLADRPAAADRLVDEFAGWQN